MKPVSLAPAYAALYPLLAEVAREHGYALTLHGSLARDMDLVAVPWESKALDTLAFVPMLVERIRAAGFDPAVIAPHGPQRMPHGRLAWTIPLGNGAALDLSVVPFVSPLLLDIDCATTLLRESYAAMPATESQPETDLHRRVREFLR